MDQHDDDADATAHLIAGADHARAGRINDAEIEFAFAVLAAPRMHIARFQLGLLQWSSRRPSVALVSWQPLMDLPAGLELGHFARGFRLWAAADLAAAEAEFREGVVCCYNGPLAQDMLRLLDMLAALQAQHVLVRNYGGHLH
jgi:hypothetical protein